MKKSIWFIALLSAAVLLCLSGCGKTAQEQTPTESVVMDDNSADDAATEQEETEPAANDTVKNGIDYLALVNKLHPLPDGWEDSLETVQFTNSIGDEVVVEKRAYDAYLQLKEELEKEGVYVDLDSALRTVDEQQRIMDDFIRDYGADYAAKTVATPGYSEHHTGLALDLYLIIDGKDVTENEDMVQYPEIWSKIHEKLADYGFILRYLEGKEHVTGYAYEPWHIRYIDDPSIAKTIMDAGETFEAYLGDATDTDVNIDYGTSSIFTQEELKEAAVKIKCDFAKWKGCELHSLRYVGDSGNSQRNLDWLNSLADGTNYKQAAEFVGDFHSPKDGGKWEPDHEYKDYHWWLANTNDGWELVISGMEEDSSNSSSNASSGNDSKEETTTENKAATTQHKDGFSVSPTNGSMFCIADDGVNIRTGYSTDDNILGVLHYGDKVPITGIVQKDGADYGWYQIDFNGQKAYVIAEYFTTKQPAGEQSDEAAAEDGV